MGALEKWQSDQMSILRSSDMDDFKRQFYLITYSEYYPGGGLFDVVRTYDKLDDAIKACSDGSVCICDAACYVFDRLSGTIVFDLYEKST